MKEFFVGTRVTLMGMEISRTAPDSFNRVFH